MAEGPGRALRSDAAQNRARLLLAARRLFAERGHAVPLEDVAREAGVTRATLYRHFPTREDLVVTVFDENIRMIERRAAELADRDDAVIELFDLVLSVQRDDRALPHVLNWADPAWFADLVERTKAVFEPLLERGLRAGLVHPGVDVDDIMLVFPMATGAITDNERQGRILMHDRVQTLLHRALFTQEPPPPER